MSVPRYVQLDIGMWSDEMESRLAALSDAIGYIRVTQPHSTDVVARLESLRDIVQGAVTAPPEVIA